jgi:hypothetical protein
MKSKYDKYIQELRSFYDNALATTKNHYEEYIKDVKLKSKKHIDIQRNLKEVNESRLSNQLKDALKSIV